MENFEKSENLFSERTFHLLKQWDKKHERNSLNIAASENSDFLEFVQKPFVKFCSLICQEIPQEIAGFNQNNFDSCVPDQAMISLNSGDQGIFGLKMQLCLYSILEITITFKGIIIRFIDEMNGLILQAIANKNPLDVKNLFLNYLKNPWIGDFWPLYLVADENILGFSTQKLIDSFTNWFEKYLPLLIFAFYDKTIKELDYYIISKNKQYLLPECAEDEESGFNEALLDRWVRSIKRKKQIIFYGSPGTGKTFIAEKLAKHLIGGSNGFSELVQFHPAYSYEDFIQGIRPQSQDGQLKYSLVPGRFLEFCKKAEFRKGICVLIIDEINRANLAQVFGELMYLLEYRYKEIPLAGGNTFRIPSNVHIIGTMNTADRSIALVDRALRRRFAFIEIRPNYDVLRNYHEKKNTGFKVDGLIQVLQKLNVAIADKNYELGISFFLTENLAEEIKDIWQMEIEPYLEEYFFDRLEKVDEFRWDKIENHVSPKKQVSP